MIWFIIAGIIFIVGIIVLILSSSDADDAFFGGVLLFSICVAVALIVNLISSGILMICDVDTEAVKTEEIAITALADNGNASGKFFLGSGHVDEEIKYYYIEMAEHGKHMNSINAKNVYLIENNTETPRIEKYTQKWKNKSWYWIANFTLHPNYTQIYIPEGAVTTEFNVDLQ